MVSVDVDICDVSVSVSITISEDGDASLCDTMGRIIVSGSDSLFLVFSSVLEGSDGFVDGSVSRSCAVVSGSGKGVGTSDGVGR